MQRFDGGWSASRLRCSFQSRNARNVVTLCRATVLCGGLASAAAALGCAAQQRLSMPMDTPTANGLAMPLYDGSAYYNAVKDRWFGLGDYATDQPGR
jgi:hypothetical protein